MLMEFRTHVQTSQLQQSMCGLSVDNELRPFVQFVALLNCMLFSQVFRLDVLGRVELMQRYCPLTHIGE